MRRSAPIRVMIVDDHDMVRRGLATILKVTAGLELVGEADNGKEALRVCEQVQPEVILMDLVMPEMDGATATRAIRELCPQTQVIALTSFKEKELVEAALEAGAIGYLLKNVSADELADAIRQAHAGRPTLAPEVAQVLDQAEKLERLAHAILDAPPDRSTLPELLKEHIPELFPSSRIEIRVFPGQTLLRHPVDWPAVPDPAWEWLRAATETQCTLPGTALPWGERQPAGEGMVLAPIKDIETAEPIGGLYLMQSRDPGTVADLVPLVKSVAAYISSALHSAQVYAQTVAQRRVARELALAGQIQASFLPGKLPDVAGWQLAATLEPARETSGDFYDVFSLPNGHLGIIIADVADKGMGAALYMALCRTLVRTYAAEYDTRPELVLSAANRRILSDARAGLFVTAFYGILAPSTGTLTYCNAGHCPPYLLSAHDKDRVRTLPRTGMALGVVEDEFWRQGVVQLCPGDLLLLYTDGVTEAQDPQGTFFGTERLPEIVLSTLGSPGSQKSLAQEIHDTLMAEVREFVGDAPQFDDMTLVIVTQDG